jgi:hypothetical protein
MNKSKSDTGDAGELRRRAEQRFAAGRADANAGDADTGLETHRLLHELQVHQVELQMQNENAELGDFGGRRS